MSITRRHILATIAAATVLGASGIAQAADTVRIGLPTKTYWPTTIAETAVRQKLFEKEGIAAELTIYRGGAETFEAMAAGAAAIDCKLGRDAFLLEQLLTHRGFRDRGRPVGFGGKADADGIGCLHSG